MIWSSNLQKLIHEENINFINGFQEGRKIISLTIPLDSTQVKKESNLLLYLNKMYCSTKSKLFSFQLIFVKSLVIAVTEC